MFPILYASILGRATHTLLLWRLERGEAIGVLDVLASSTSFTSTVASQVQLRSLSAIGVALIAVWALSPIGGQASLRQMGIEMSIQSHPTSFEYMVHSGYGDGFPTAQKTRQPKEYLNVIFNGAIVAPAAVRTTPRDLWGNVKIPMIEHYEKYNKSDTDGWYDTRDGVPSTYTSFIGIPIALATNASGYINHTMRMHTPYMYAVCSLNASMSYSDIVSPSYLQADNGTHFENITNVVESGDPRFVNMFESTSAGLFTQAERTNVEIGGLKPLILKYATNARSSEHDFLLTCNITGTYVETEIICPRSWSCAANRVRRSKVDHFQSSWTFLDAHKTNLEMLGGLMKSSTGEEGFVTLVDRYLSDPAVPLDSKRLFYVQKQTSAEDYSIRLGQLLNSYLTASSGLFAITGGINNDTVYRWDEKQSFVPDKFRNNTAASMAWDKTDRTSSFNFTGDIYMKAKVWRVEGTRSTFTEVIRANKFWVAVLCVASNVLILASLISPLVKHFLIKGPEVMVNISSLATRNNPYVPLPDSGFYLEASDRARLLKEVHIRFGDTETENKIGKLVIGSVDFKGLDIARIKSGRTFK